MSCIAIITNSLSGGGAERSMNLIANALHEKNQKVFLVAINDGPKDLVQLQVPVVEIKRKWQGSTRNSVVSFFRFHREIRKIRPDIAIVNCDLPELFSLFVPLYAQIICVEHTTNPWRGRKLLGRIVRSYLRFRNSVWIRVSEHINPWPKSLNFKGVIRNPVHSNVGVKTSDFLNPIIRLVFIGRLSSEKNPDFLIEIGKLLNIDVLIIGDGILKSEMKEKAVALGVRVEFLGHVLDPWLQTRSGDLLVFPSEYEGDGLVVLEALSRRIPFMLRTIPAFLRFNFSDLNYFNSTEQFVEIFTRIQDKPNLLIPSQDISSLLLSEREIQTISHNWLELIEETLNPH